MTHAPVHHNTPHEAAAALRRVLQGASDDRWLAHTEGERPYVMGLHHGRADLADRALELLDQMEEGK